MSAIVHLARPNSIEILTDTASCDAAGVYRGCREKFFDLGGGYGVAAIGDVAAIDYFFRRLLIPAAKNADFDKFLGRLRRGLAILRWGRRRFGAMFQIYGLDRAGVPRALRFAAAEGLGLPRLTLEELPRFYCSSARDGTMAGAGDLDPSATLESRAASLSRALRMPAWQVVSGREFVGVGGQMLVTKITRKGIETRVVGYFSDLIGEPINPARAFIPVVRKAASRSRTLSNDFNNDFTLETAN